MAHLHLHFHPHLHLYLFLIIKSPFISAKTHHGKHGSARCAKRNCPDASFDEKRCSLGTGLFPPKPPSLQAHKWWLAVAPVGTRFKLEALSFSAPFAISACGFFISSRATNSSTVIFPASKCWRPSRCHSPWQLCSWSAPQRKRL